MASDATLQLPVGPAISADPAATDVRCTHCSLPVARGLRRAGAGAQFCCHGCETAYGIIHSCGLDRYYALDAAAGDRAPARATGRSYAEFDDPTFRALYVRGQVGGVCVVELYLAAVHCGACLWLIERLPRLHPAVIEARLDMHRAIVRLTWNDAQAPLSAIAKLLDSIGYPPHPAKDARARQARREQDHRQLVRLAVAGACAGNVMLLAVCLYAGLFSAIEEDHRQLFRWASMLITLVALVWPGRVFFTSAWAAVRSRTPHLDVPIALALGAGGLWSIYTTILGRGEIYFDTVSVLIFALLAGRFVQARQQRGAADSVELLFALTPATARRVETDDGHEVVRDVPTEALALGDLVEVRAGESIPADGDLEVGRSSVDQSLLTGESRAVEVVPGMGLAAGTVNLGSAIRVRVRATGSATRVGRLMRLVEDAASRKAPILHFADKVAAMFVVGMIALAALTLAVWAVLDATHALDHAVALLVVTCPCALGVASPLVVSLALGRAARRGMLIKGGDALQALSGRGVIFLDKTGTITKGGLHVAGTHAEQCPFPSATLWSMVAALEAHASHPIARAITNAFGPGESDGSGSVDAEHAHEVRDVRHVLGGGLEGTVNGRRLIVGSPAFVVASAQASPAIDARARDAAAAGQTPVAVAIDGTVVGLLAMGDTLRSDSAEAIDRLRAMGWEVRVLSGDHADVVRAVASRVGIAPEDASGDLSPEHKLQVIRREIQRRPGATVVMVGDGVNDAASLAAATVGVAVQGGAEASLAAADAYLTVPGLMPLLDLIEGSRRALKVIRLTLWASLGYNVVAAALAVLGLISPLIAAVVMPISSITALAIALRARTFDHPDPGLAPAPTASAVRKPDRDMDRHPKLQRAGAIA